MVCHIPLIRQIFARSLSSKSLSLGLPWRWAVHNQYCFGNTLIASAYRFCVFRVNECAPIDRLLRTCVSNDNTGKTAREREKTFVSERCRPLELMYVNWSQSRHRSGEKKDMACQARLKADESIHLRGSEWHAETAWTMNTRGLPGEETYPDENARLSKIRAPQQRLLCSDSPSLSCGEMPQARKESLSLSLSFCLSVRLFK